MNGGICQCVRLKIIRTVMMSNLMMALIKVSDGQVMMMGRTLIMLMRYKIMNPECSLHHGARHRGKHHVASDQHQEEGSEFDQHLSGQHNLLIGIRGCEKV